MKSPLNFESETCIFEKSRFNSAETDAVLLVDAENAFNSINRQALLHNIQYICPVIHTFVYNCYNVPTRLFIIGGKEIKSTEGTTQGDPTAMATYALGLVPLLECLLNSEPEHKPKMVAFADDLTGAGNLADLHSWWHQLLNIGPKYGYFPKPSKSYIIVKEEKLDLAKVMFSGTRINITSSGKRHLGAVIGSKEYKDEYVTNLVFRWKNELEMLSKIADIQPQAAYAAYIHGFKSKFTYFLRTISDIADLLQPIEDVLRNMFIPAITGGVLCSDIERRLLSLPIKMGGLGIDIVSEISDQEYDSSRQLTSSLIEDIINQNTDTNEHQNDNQIIKNEITKNRRQQRKISVYSFQCSGDSHRMSLN